MMTREEAIKWLREAEVLDLTYGRTKDREAVDMAIEALKAQEGSNDLISRQAAIDALNSINGTVELDEAFSMIESLPSVQPERKKGKYTNKELEVFRHAISLKLCSKRSAQHWHYDEDTAKDIEFLEQLYEKVGADMREGAQE